VIALEGVSARRAPFALARVDLTWGPGVHSIVGGPDDGGRQLLALVAGDEPPRRGRVRALDGDPRDDRVRRRIARVDLEPPLPEALRVDEMLRVSAAIRGEPARPATERLGTLGLEALALRRISSLSRAEARGVALTEALTSTRSRVLLLVEPLVAVDGRAVARLPEAIRAKRTDGSVVLVATSSVRDATELAQDHLFLHRGSVVARADSLEQLAIAALCQKDLVVVVDNVASARSWVTSFSRLALADRVEQEGRVVRVRGRDALALARAAALAAGQAGVNPIELRWDAPSLAEALGASRAISADENQREIAARRTADANAHGGSSPGGGL
jgi:ABC-2 type transport system ATP-binding protein